MNKVRIAALLRELADEFDADSAPAPAESRPRAKRERRPRTIVRPPGEAAAAVAGRAARLLQDKGFR